MKILLSFFSGILSLMMLVSPFSPVSRVDNKPDDAEIVDENVGETEEKRITVRVATYNIRGGSDVEHDLSIIAQDILDNNVEIVGFQEVDKNTNRSGNVDMVKELAALTGYEYCEFTRCISYDGGYYGTAILSKYPIEEYEAVFLPSGHHEQRKLGHATININGVMLNFFNTHLSWEDADVRAEQFATIAEYTADCEYFIVTGDFNTANFDSFKAIPNSNIVNNEENRMVSCGEDGAIDNIVYSDGIRLDGSGMYDEVDHSDHHMVWADFSFDMPAAETETDSETEAQ